MKIIYSYYVLDILHPGHLLQMRNAKRIAGEDGISIVGILTDEATMEKKAKPTMTFEERLEIARSIKYNDIVVPQSTYSPIPNLQAIRPDIHMESTSHTSEDIENVRKLMKSQGGDIIVMPYYPTESSTRIKNKIKETRNEKK